MGVDLKKDLQKPENSDSLQVPPKQVEKPDSNNEDTGQIVSTDC